MNQLLVGNTFIALYSENTKYSHVPLLKKFRALTAQWMKDPAQPTKSLLDSGFWTRSNSIDLDPAMDGKKLTNT